MKKVYQTLFGEGKGNCFQACVASIFEMSLGEVPHFCLVPEDKWYGEYVRWLQKKGYSTIMVEAKDLDKGNYKDCILIVSGYGPDGVRHSVIYKNGKILHNPNKNGKGIKPDAIDIIFPLNPAPAPDKDKRG